MRGTLQSFLIVLLLGTTAFCQDKEVIDGQTGKAIAAFVRLANKRVGFSGAVLCAKGGKVVAALAVGSTGGKKSVPLKTTTLFELASATKPFTATAIMMLQERGKLRIDDSIAKHLPGVPRNCRSITIRHLLQHTSGIPGDYSRGRGTDLSIVLPRFLAGGPQYAPGKHWEYWNQGYALLSEIIARASGKTYVQFCREEIFATCKMSSSRFNGDSIPANGTVAIGRAENGKDRSALEHPYGEYGFQYRGMGGLVTNVWDVWRWDRALRANKLLKAATRKQMINGGRYRYGLGWFVGKTKSGKSFHMHSGRVRGFLADIRRYPDDDACLVVLANSDLTTPMFMTLAGCERLLFGEPHAIKFPIQLKPERLKALAGRYEDGRHRVVVIHSEGKIGRVKIIWRMWPPTHAYVGKDAMGQTRLFGYKLNHAMNVDMDPSRKHAKSITLLNNHFFRKMK